MIIWSSDESEIEKFELGKVVKIMENVKDKAGSMDELKELAAKAGAMENKPMREKQDIDLSTPADFTPQNWSWIRRRSLPESFMM